MSLEKLDQLAVDGKMSGFTLFETNNKHWQASLRDPDTRGYRVMRAATPSLAIAAVLAMDFVDDPKNKSVFD